MPDGNINVASAELQGLVELLPQMERASRFEEDLKYFLGWVPTG